MTSPRPTPTPESAGLAAARGARLRHLASEISKESAANGVLLTAEVHDADGSVMVDAKVVDVVRIGDDTLHFVVVLDD